MNVPNFLTIVRFAIIPVFFIVRPYITAVLFLAGGITDVLISYI